MNIKQHAVRRYKKRIGDRTASKQRIIRKINKEIEKNTVKKEFNNDTGQYRIYTRQFTAVCRKNTVITILPPREIPKPFTAKMR